MVRRRRRDALPFGKLLLLTMARICTDAARPMPTVKTIKKQRLLVDFSHTAIHSFRSGIIVLNRIERRRLHIDMYTMHTMKNKNRIAINETYTHRR